MASTAGDSVPSVLFVLGGPGAGKGTQCGFITEDFEFEHLSAGDLLRAERKNPKSEFGELISNYIAEGKIVPVEITVKLLMNAMQASSCPNFLIDGFPRNQNNVDGWNSVVGDKANAVGCLFFDCPEDVMENRLLERGKSSGRTDDNIESIRKRFRTYQNETMPVINHFQKENKCFKVIADRDMNVIREEVRGILKEKLSFKERDSVSKAVHGATELSHKAVDAVHNAADAVQEAADQAAEIVQQAAAAMQHAAEDAMHAAEDAIHKAEEGLSKAGVAPSDIPPGVKAAIGVAFLSTVAFILVRTISKE